MLTSAKWLMVVFVGLFGTSAGQEAGNKPAAPAGPPPVYLPLTTLTPDATIAIGGERRIAVMPDGVWVSSRAAGTLTRVDPKTHALGAPVDVGKEPCFSVLSAFKSVWTPLCGGPGLARFDSAFADGAAPAGKPALTLITTAIRGAGPIVAGTGSIWMITDAGGVLSRIDPDTNAVVAEIMVPAGPAAMAFGEDAVWVASAARDAVTRVNGHTNVVAEIIKVGRGPSAVAVGDGAVWTLNSGDGTVSRIDPKTNKVTVTIKTNVTGNGGTIAVGEGSVWLSAPGMPLTRLDPITNQMLQQFSGPGGGALAIGLKSIWIAATPTAIWRVDPKRVEATRR